MKKRLSNPCAQRPPTFAHRSATFARRRGKLERESKGLGREKAVHPVGTIIANNEAGNEDECNLARGTADEYDDIELSGFPDPAKGGPADVVGFRGVLFQ